MIDGKGHFLPESKRALPTPNVAFYKMFGLSKLFPRSRIFGQYHLGYMDENQTHKVPVLPGAFMLLRRTALDMIGLLDESFFMYGEDIDLSYRLTQAGYKNYYYPETLIIHYKGESTKKDSFNYVLIFYRAMIIFTRKHFHSKMANFLRRFIHIAIYIRAFISIGKRFFKEIILPAGDFLGIYFCFSLFVPFWAQYKFNQPDHYSPGVLNWFIPSLITIWIISIWSNGGYQRPFRLTKLYKGIIWGTFIILVIYALLPINMKFSRAFIVLGAGGSIIITTLLRFFFHVLPWQEFEFAFKTPKRIAIVGFTEEAERVRKIIEQTTPHAKFTGYVYPDKGIATVDYLGNIDQLSEIIRLNKINEVIFCSKEMRTQTIIRKMLLLSGGQIEFKIAPEESFSVIGSNSINHPGDLYVININSIVKKKNIYKKRLFDFFSSLFLIIFSPVLLLIQKKRSHFFSNILHVLSGKYSWVGIELTNGNGNNKSIPGIFHASDLFKSKKIIKNSQQHSYINMAYAQDYHVFNDIKILFYNIGRIGAINIHTNTLDF
ncbi:MAG: glycosyltransferase, partial [Bacteroidota bacterium]